MSHFAVTREIIETAKDHSNADRLGVYTLVGRTEQIISGKGSHHVGDEVIYFPVDSLIPEQVQEKLGVAGRLSGKAKNRLKTIRLRGKYSQGLIASVAILGNDAPSDLTEYFGILKYIRPAVASYSGNLIELPVGLSAYDIEGANRHTDIVDQLMDIPVFVQEKIEGSNLSITYIQAEQRTVVNQRNFQIEELPPRSWWQRFRRLNWKNFIGYIRGQYKLPPSRVTHTWWNAARNLQLLDFMTFLVADHPNTDITIYGEIIGPAIQGNYYKLTQHQVRIFDIRVGRKYMDPVDLMENIAVFFQDKQQDMIAPVLASGHTLREVLDDKDVTKYSYGRSMLINRLREGVVIRPMEFIPNAEIGRTIIKQRDPVYLYKNEDM